VRLTRRGVDKILKAKGRDKKELRRYMI